MKKIVALFIILICLCSLSGCESALDLRDSDMVADVYYENEASLQAAVDALLSIDISYPMYIDPIERESIHYYYECEVGKLRFKSGATDEELFDADCHKIYDTIAPLFETLNLWRIKVLRNGISFVFEFKKGYASELFYVYDKNANGYKTLRIVEDELQINDYWYAVTTYDPDTSP